MITTPRTSTTRRHRPLIAAVATLLTAALLGPSAALADTISVDMSGADATVDDTVTVLYQASANASSTAYLYLEAGRAGCPSSADAAAAAGMTLLGSEAFTSSIPPWSRIEWTPSAEGDYLVCGYSHRQSDTTTARAADSQIITVQEPADAPIVTIAATQPLTTSNTVTADVSCPRACSLYVDGWVGTDADSYSASFALGTATAVIGTFGGSTTVQVPIARAEARDLRQRLTAGERVRAELDVLAAADNGRLHSTNAPTELTLLRVGSGSRVVRVFSGL